MWTLTKIKAGPHPGTIRSGAFADEIALLLRTAVAAACPRAAVILVHKLAVVVADAFVVSDIAVPPHPVDIGAAGMHHQCTRFSCLA